MRKSIGIAIAFFLLLVAGGGLWLLLRTEPPPPGPVRTPPPEPERPTSRARPGEEPDAALLARARELLGEDGRRESCGPYALLTDVADARLLNACGRLASEIDELYEERYGLSPLGEPAEAIVLFAEMGDYRTFARESGVPLGYAGYALAPRGLAVFHAGDSEMDDFLSTLTHELTHLVHRRSLGVNLPPWLSEGLADGIGDTATEEGFRPLVGIEGSEMQAKRLREAYESGRAGQLRRLVGLRRGEFDRAAVSFDYEQSALFVRFLLSEPATSAAFRAWLRDFAQGETESSEQLDDVLGVDFSELERRFEVWVRGR